MELFHKDGHLTAYAFEALRNDELGELGRLEVAEHLDYCDECLLIYSSLLTDDTLQAPPQPIAPGVLLRIRKRIRAIFFHKYITVAACACLTLVLWFSGIFSVNIPHIPKPNSINQASTSFSQTAGNWIFDRLIDFNKLFLPAERSSTR